MIAPRIEIGIEHRLLLLLLQRWGTVPPSELALWTCTPGPVVERLVDELTQVGYVARCERGVRLLDAAWQDQCMRA